MLRIGCYGGRLWSAAGIVLPFKCFAFYLVGPGGNGFITATAAACWLARTAAVKTKEEQETLLCVN